MDYINENPDELLRMHMEGTTFLAIHPSRGVVVAARDEETMEAEWNELRPSEQRQLFLTHTSLWCKLRTQGNA